MNKLDHSIMKHDVFEVLKDLNNLRFSSVKQKRTPADLTEKITLICQDLRKKDGALDADITDLEDHMWYCDTALERLTGIAGKTRMIDIVP